MRAIGAASLSFGSWGDLAAFVRAVTPAAPSATVLPFPVPKAPEPEPWPDAAANSKGSFDAAIEALHGRLEASRVVLAPGVELYNEDAAFILPTLRNLHACITDPPYELSNDGKQSAARVFLEFAFPKNAKIEAKLGRENCLPLLISEVLSLSSVRAVPAPAAPVKVVPVAFNDHAARGDDEVEHNGESSVGVSYGAARVQSEAKVCKHLGCFALKLADTAHARQVLNAAGAGFLSGSVGVGLRIDPSRDPSALHGLVSVVDGDHDVGLCAGPLSDLIGAFVGATSRPVFAFKLGRGSVEEFTANGARMFATALKLSGAELVRADAAASGLAAPFEARRVCVIDDFANRAFSFDLLVHTQDIASVGFMNKAWDGSKVSFDVGLWLKVSDALLPGASLISFAGTRTYHRIACAVEDAGFEPRTILGWLFGSGFPKGKDQLKPAFEPAVFARKPPSEKTVAANVLKHGAGAINVDACRITSGEKLVRPTVQRFDNLAYGKGLGAGVQVEPEGRWPANIMHDGSDEVVALFPRSKAGKERKPRGTGGIWSGESNDPCGPQYDDDGSAARFFYCAKVSPKERGDSKHPTMKPIALMEWLCKLVTPPGGTIVDPFCGSGSTGVAAVRNGFKFVGIEKDPESFATAVKRIKAALAEKK